MNSVSRALLVFPMLLLLTPQSATAQSTCRTFEPGEQVSSLQDTEIDEASGLAASWRNPGVFWVHNDSGDSARLFAINEQGETLTVVDFPGLTARDWEDIAIGPCAEGSTTACIFVGDIGDNSFVRDDIRVHRFEEPLLDGSATMTIDSVDSFHVTYPDGPLNSETLLVHPVSAEVFIVDKTPGDPNHVFQIPTDGPNVTATKIATFDVGEPSLIGGRITGGDFSPSGDEISIRTYAAVYTFCGPDAATAFANPTTRVIGYDFFQSESLTYARDGESLWSTSEVRSSERPPLVQMPVVRPETMEPSGSDAGGSVPDAGVVRDQGSAPGADGGAAPAPGSGGCSCCHAKAEAPWGALGFGFFGLVFLRLRTRTARSRSGTRVRA